MENWLLIGSGGREYAMAKQLTKNSNRHVYVAPGNPMMNILANVETVDINECEFNTLIDFAKQNEISWTLVGPEKPLSEGIVDAFKTAGLNIFGPQKDAARLESSKEFAKDVMTAAKVATAKYATFDNQADALGYLSQTSFPVVIKLNGLASGKGVFIAENESDAKSIIMEVYKNNSQQEILLEDYLVGQEFSMIVMVNDLDVITMPLAQDHKRIYDGDKGLNTGGMGAYSPLPQFGDDVLEDGLSHVIRPILNEMHKRHILFQGFLYAGLIMTDEGIKVIEFNVRMGDPETQVILPQLQDDFGDVIKKLMQHQHPTVSWTKNRYYLGNVLAAKGYPQQHLDALTLPEFNQANIDVDYAGVKEQDEKLVSSGGRIMMVITSDTDLSTAKNRVNQAIQDTVDSRLYSYRTDIGAKALR